MSSFRRSIQAEILKGKNSFAFWLAFIGTSGVALSLFFLALFDGIVWEESPNSWRAWVHFHYAGTDFMLLPLFVIIIASLVTYQEHRNHLWKHWYVSTVSRWHLYAAKLVYIVLLFSASHLYFVGLLLVSGLLFGIIQPDTQLLTHFPDVAQLGGLAVQTITTILGMLALQYWISYRFRSFIVALGFGVIGFVTASLIIDTNDHILWHPYAYPLLYVQAQSLGESTLAASSNLSFYSIGYFLLFTVVGYWDIRRLDA
uniref:ABC transporter permease n=1 Tax=Roseihalotalea indica TaxID=2867963 RepID=A0AA49GLM7_9BACT|nr:ABC transporter permease [Tunicatimonas sp. TK19036]